jgi:multidrug efflux system outer membrane protein
VRAWFGWALLPLGVAWCGIIPDGLDGKWWARLGDPELTSLIERAVKANLDLKVASSRLLEARAGRRSARAGLLPEVESANNLRRLRGGLTSGLFDPNRESSLLAPAETSFYQLGFDASWEIDLFGGRRHALEAATADLKAVEEAQRDTVLSVEAEVARNYAELRACQRRVGIARRNIRLQEDALGLTRAQAAELDAARAALPSIESAEFRIIQRIGVLLGAEPRELLDELRPAMPLPAVSAAVPVDLPAELLRRRPDVRQAEALVAAETARVGVARSDLFPKIILTGAAGRQATEASGLALGAGNFFPVGPSITLPIFSGGRIRARIEVQKQRLHQAETHYRSTVLRAIEEAENSIASYEKEKVRREILADAVEARRRSTALANELYAGGLSDFLTVLAAQRRELSAEEELAQSDLAVLTDCIALYKALGGGWD